MTDVTELLLAEANGDDPATVRILRPESLRDEQVFEPWWIVAESPDAATRVSSALALWNTDLLALIPRYNEALRTKLVDIVVTKHSWLQRPSLDYVLRRESGGFVVWIGEDPRDRATETPLYGAVPQAVRTFTRTVHAGYTAYDGESNGINSPARMQTLSKQWGRQDDDDMFDWEENFPLPRGRRLLVLTNSGTTSSLLVSPDLPDGAAITYFEPDFELADFAESLDFFMTLPVDS